MPKVNSLDVLAIKNVISRYCEALDTKDFAILENVFLRDISANYPFNSTLQGIEAVTTAIRDRLGPIRTHHNLTTQTIVFDNMGRSAQVITYFQGAHFGQGPHEGKLLCAYGRYIDDLVIFEASGDTEGVPGASGIWRIKRRIVVFTQRIGDEKIMAEH